MPKLTKKLIDEAKAPADGQIMIWDTELPGFGLRVHGSGRKVYLVRYRVKDASQTQRKMTLARSTDMPPEKARELARKVFAQVADGQDPVAERKPTAPDKAKTVEKMFQGYVASLKARNRASAGEVERALLIAKNNAADALGRHKEAADVTSTDIVDYLAGFYQAGHRGAANKHRGYIASAYTWAMKAANDYTVPTDQRVDFGITINPATTVAKDPGATQTRDRNLDAAELRQLWLDTDPSKPGFWPETASCIRLLICCGQRVQETLRMDGSEIDLEKGLWNMPAHKTKGKKHPHTIPLPQQAIPVLQGLIDQYGDGPLFPSRYGAARELLHHDSIMQAIRRWCDDKGVEAFQTRDLRRTWKSRAHDAGVDRFTRDLIQQHAQGDTGSKHYDRASYLPQMQEAMKKWGEWLDKVTGDPAPVVPLKAA